MFEVEIKDTIGLNKQTVFGFGKDEESARADVMYVLCDESKIPRENIRIIRLIY